MKKYFFITFILFSNSLYATYYCYLNLDTEEKCYLQISSPEEPIKSLDDLIHYDTEDDLLICLKDLKVMLYYPRRCEAPSFKTSIHTLKEAFKTQADRFLIHNSWVVDKYSDKNIIVYSFKAGEKLILSSTSLSPN